MCKKKRVLHCPEIIGGNSFLIAQAERKIGLESLSAALFSNSSRYPIDKVFASPHMSFWKRKFPRTRLFILALFHYDIIHYNFGSSIFQKMPFAMDEKYFFYKTRIFLSLFRLFSELLFFKIFRKKILVFFQGCDARLGGIQCSKLQICKINECKNCHLLDSAKISAGKIWHLFADQIFWGEPDIRFSLPSGIFLPISPIELAKYQPIYSTNNEILQIVHAPTSKNIKGTSFILEAIQKLKDENFHFDFHLIQNLPHEDALEKYKQADLVIDQLLLGWYGGFSCECMALGKPVICNINEDFMCVIPEEMCNEMPFILATPDSLYTVLKQYLTDRSKLQGIGRKSRIYMEHWHSPDFVAQTLLHYYKK